VLIFVRHGRTEANAAGLLQGRLDLPLDAVGVTQVRQVARAIGPVDRVICSPLLRARQTAAVFDAPCTIDERWIELDYGTFEGLPMSAITPEVWEAWKSETSFCLDNGESLDRLDARVRPACVDAFQSLGDGITVVVSHVSPIKAAIAWVLGGDISMSWRCHLAQAGVTRVIRGSTGPVLSSFNEVLYI
jgi:alpha-ribazole phosphatase